MDCVIKIVLQTIEKYKMINKGDRIVIGVSGGADSMALLHIMMDFSKKLDFEFCVAHIEHGIRGAESVKDAEFVEDFCKCSGIKFYCENISAVQMAEELKIPVEMAGRIARYRFFDQVASDFKGNKIALAHHLEDQTETVLHNIIRGSGLKGLTGMEPIRDNKYIRPLFEVTKQQILDYCNENNIIYHTDKTNFDTDYTRNWIRLELIPLLKKHINPSIERTIFRTADILRDDDEYLSYESEKAYRSIAEENDSGVILPLSLFNNLDISVRRRVLRLALSRIAGFTTDFEFKHIDAVLALSSGGRVGSHIDITNNIGIEKGYDNILIRLKRKQVSVVCNVNVPGINHIKELSSVLKCSIIEVVNHDIIRLHDADTQYVDVDKWPDGVELRFRENGDRIFPLGSPGYKKLKEYMIDRKIDRWKRNKIPLLTKGNDVLWVIGYDISDKLKITDHSKNILKLEYIKI